MEPNLQILAKKADTIVHQLYEKIFSFLDFPSLMQALSVSQDFYHLLNKYFKSFLKTNNLIADSETRAEVDEHYYLKLFRAFYAREVLVGQLASIKSSYSEMQLVRYPRCSTYGVKDFSMGGKFIVFHLYNNDIIFLKNEEYLNPLFNMKNINRKNIRKNVSSFSTDSNDLFYLTSSGHLHVIFHSADLPSHELSEGILDITLGKPLSEFSVCYPHAVLLFRVPEDPNRQKNSSGYHEEKKEDKAHKVIYQDIRSLELHNLVAEDFNSPARLKKVEGLDDQRVISFCVGTAAAYFLTEKNQVYECDLNALNNDKYMIFIHEHMKNKAIRRLWSGKNFFFALEQNENPSILDWTQNEILKWASTKDFSEFVNILKYENITGKDLVNADKAFFIDRLGMDREDLRVKFKNEIEKVSTKTYTKPRLLGWGNNSYGQLGLNTGHVVVNHPSEVKQLPELEKGDHIEDVECGVKATAIITQKGKVWITEVLPKRVVAPKEEEDTSKQAGGKKKKKESVDITKEKEEKPFVRWLDLTPICEKLKDGRQYKVIKITLSKDYFAVLGANCGQKKKAKGKGKGEEEEQTHSVKLKGADHICNRLLWDKSLNKDEFIVGYEDRFLGILEIPFNEFSLKTDIPSHRIKFFKRNGEVVWDRTTKVNII